jgi:peptidoglycan/LPS O-acetylase OafA/YrhL
MVAVNAIVELQQTRTLSDFWMVAAATYSLAAMSWWLVEKPYLRKKTGTLKVPVVT